MEITYTIEENNKTIKQILKERLFISDRLLTFLKKNSLILYNNDKITNLNILARLNSTVTVDLNFEEDNNNIVPIKMDLKIIYEDEALLIIDKPAGIPVHPSILHYTNSLSNGVKYYFDSINLKKKIRPVNRLDRNTSGIVIFAKNQYIQECLIHQMQTKEFKKTYLAVVEGHLKKLNGTIDAPITRKENSIIERCVAENGEKSITHYKVLKQNFEKNYDIVECLLETGRTHQIRVHLSYIGHPLIGDTLYGNNSKYISRQALHAYKVEFIHPITNKLTQFTSDLPKDFVSFII
ncbi:MAG: RluA family pseudouridine synthase [Clostridia bacterium]|jgi:pseudouridine synthase, rluA family|nr:RluA family pseudouridine synthase [Clostridia bacterium]CDE82442.1 pseudouridine synthase RluA family [Clostridium sp. CAG:273]